MSSKVVRLLLVSRWTDRGGLETALKSTSDDTLTTHFNQALVGLVGGVVKGELDAPCAALPQAIQISCDFLYHAVHVLQVPVADVAIPFVVVGGGTVQTGAVYSLEHEFYPVPVLLTPPMSLYFLDAVYPVLEGLVSYFDTHLLRLPFHINTRDVPETRLLRLEPHHHFFKPLQLPFQTSDYSHYRLHRLLALFDALYACEDLREIVVFPVGFIAYPDRKDLSFFGKTMIDGFDKMLNK